jgi:hypothetical protein
MKILSTFNDKEYEFLSITLTTRYALIKNSLIIELSSILTKRKLITILNAYFRNNFSKSEIKKIKSSTKQRFLKIKNIIYIAFVINKHSNSRKIIFLTTQMIRNLKKKGIKIRERHITINRT